MLLKVTLSLIIILILVFSYTTNLFSGKNDIQNQSEYTAEENDSPANKPIQLQDQGDFTPPLPDNESISNAEGINDNNFSTEASTKQDEESLSPSKTKVLQDSTNSDSLTVDELKQEVLNDSNLEAKNEISNKATNKPQTSVSGTSAPTAQDSSASDSPTSATKATSDVTEIEIKNQETLPTVNEEQSEFSALQEKANSALQDGDPHVLHEVLKEIANHPDNPDAKAFEGSNLQNPPDEEDF